MTLQLKDPKKTWANPTFFKSWGIAARGFVHVCQHEWKVGFAFFIAFIFIGLSLVMKVSYIEVILIITLWTQVIVGEIFNTSLEKAMDYSSDKEFSPLIRTGKDYAAASVFVLTLLATGISTFILWKNF